MGTFEKSGKIYKLVKIDRNTVRRVLVGTVETSNTPLISEKVNIKEPKVNIKDEKVNIKELSKLPHSKLRPEIKNLSKSDKKELIKLEKEKANPRKSIIKLLK